MARTMADHWILHAKSRCHHYRGAGTTSLKSFAGGEAHYVLDHGERTIDATRYMLLNEGQPYEIAIDAPQPVESFCVFFRPGFAREVHRDLTASLPVLLDDPAYDRPLPQVEFDTAPRPLDAVVAPILARLKAAPAPEDREEHLHLLVEVLLMVRRRPPATHPELTRRLWLAYDHLRSNLAAGPALAELAAVAALSPNHLIRTYRAAFGRTPHQHLTELRLQRAHRLLTTRDFSVTEVCLEVGFSSLGSFSDAFRRRFGVRPSHLGDPGEAERTPTG